MTNWETSFRGGFDDFKPQQNFVSVNDFSQAFNGLSGPQQNQSFSNLQGNQNQRFQPYNTQPQRYSTNQPINTNLTQNNQTNKPEFSNIEEQKFLQLLKQVSSNGSGTISASSCANFLRTTSLPNRILANIWDLADHKKQGFLQIEGFFIAMRAVALYQHHQKLIPELIYKKAPKNENSLLPKIGHLNNIELNKNTSYSLQQTIKPNSSNNIKTSFKQIPLSTNIENKQNINTTEVVKPSSSKQNLPLNLLKISQEEHQDYSKTYSQLDINNDGFVTGQNNQVINLMTRSKLDNEILSRIWDLCSDEKKLKIDKNNFIITLHLINCTKIGITIPTNFAINSIKIEKKSNENRMNELSVIKNKSNEINNNQLLNPEPNNQQLNTDIEKSNSQKNLFENLFNQNQNLTFPKIKPGNINSKSQQTPSKKEENIPIIQNYDETKSNESTKTKEHHQEKEMKIESVKDIKLDQVIAKNEMKNNNEKQKAIINGNHKFEALKKLENSYPNEKNNIINKDLNTFKSNDNQNDLLLNSGNNNSDNINNNLNQNNEINTNVTPKIVQNNRMNLYNRNTKQQMEINGNYNTGEMPNRKIKSNKNEAIDTIAIQKMKKEVKKFTDQLNFFQKEIEKLTSTYQFEKQKEEDVFRKNQYLKLQIKRLNDDKKVLKNNYAFLKNTLENLTYQNIEYKYILEDRINYNNNEKKRIKNLQKGKKKIQKVLLKRQKILSKINENKKINQYQIEQLSQRFDFKKFLVQPIKKQTTNNLFSNVTDKEKGQIAMETNKQNLYSEVDVEVIKPKGDVLYRPEEVFNTLEIEQRSNTNQYKNKSEYGDDESELEGFSGENEATLSCFSESNSVKVFGKTEIETETFSEMTTYITSGETSPKNSVHEIDNLQIKNMPKNHRIEEFDNFDNFSQSNIFNSTNNKPNPQKDFDDFGTTTAKTKKKNNGNNNLANFDNFKNETLNNPYTKPKKNIKLKNIKNIKIQYKSNHKKGGDLNNRVKAVKKNQEENKSKTKIKKENTKQAQTNGENKRKTTSKKDNITKKKKRNKKIKQLKNKEKKTKKNSNHSHKGIKKNKEEQKAKTKIKKENTKQAQTKGENKPKTKTKKENINKTKTKKKTTNKTKTKKESKSKAKAKKENFHKKKKITKKNKNLTNKKTKNSNINLKNFDGFEKRNNPNQTNNTNDNEKKNSKNNNFQNFNDFNNFNSQNINNNKINFEDFDKFGDLEEKQNDKKSQPKEKAFDDFSQNNAFNSSNNQNGFTFDDF